jgi:hypothetical protein
MFVVAFFIWRGFREDGQSDAPATFVNNVRADLKKTLEYMTRFFPYFVLAVAFVALYLFVTSANFTS